MNNIYELISKRDANHILKTYTVIEGENQGEKMLLVDGVLSWASGDFLKEHLTECQSVDQTGVLLIENQRVFCEKIGSEKQLVVCGAGHVSIAIITLAKLIGLKVTVIDDRPVFANNARTAGADVVICDTFASALEKIPGSQDTFFVVVTRGHQYDTDCLRYILTKPNAYIGMMGSKRRVGFVLDQLKAEGYDSEAVDRIHTPIGLKIAAETPEEIAVSVMAEIIQVKNGQKSYDGFSEDLLFHLSGESGQKQRSLLATIVSRKGSAPRSVGTKMVILQDSKTIGTIGGGCAEANILKTAQYMLLHEEERYRLCFVDMLEEQESEAGMVCGGVIEVFLEVVFHY